MSKHAVPWTPIRTAFDFTADLFGPEYTPGKHHRDYCIPCEEDKAMKELAA